MGTKKQCGISVLDGSKDRCVQKNPKSKCTCCQKTDKEKTTKGKKDPRRVVDVGLDISTAIVGIAILDANTGTMVEIDACKLNKAKFKDTWDKASEMRTTLKRMVDTEKYILNNIFVEEAHMRFTPGFSSAKTLFTLSRFNGIVSYIGFELFGVKPKMINVRTGRKNLGIKINRKDKSKDTKTKIFDAVRNMHPEFPWVQHIAKTGKQKGKMVYDKHNFDMADAYITAASGQIEYPYKK